jgi:hypothetical protein
MNGETIMLSEDSYVAVDGDWRLYPVESDAALYGIFTVNRHDYLRDGTPLTRNAPRIASVVRL